MRKVSKERTQRRGEWKQSFHSPRLFFEFASYALISSDRSRSVDAPARDDLSFQAGQRVYGVHQALAQVFHRKVCVNGEHQRRYA